MADGFEPYEHVPQQTRRDKLRIDHNQLYDHLHDLPFYTPSSLILPNSDLIARACGVNSHQVSSKLNLVKEGSMPSSYLPLNLNPNCTDTSSNSNTTTNPFVYTPPLSLELNLQRYGGGSSVLCSDRGYIVRGGGSSTNHEVSTSCVPLGPFTGYASILKGSRFLKPAQQLLEEFCDVGRSFNGDKVMDGEGLMESPGECLSGVGSESDLNGGDDAGGESRSKKSRLNSMLDEVYRKYKLYCQQLQAVVASFECVSGLGNAAPYANFALKTLSKHFRSLKNSIVDHLQFTAKAHGQLVLGKSMDTRLGNTDSGNYCRRPMQNLGFIEHHQPVWRPQRGLPERAVTVLRAWLFEHFLHPYPTDTDKIILAKQTGLSRNQVSNWFINARVRLWKPMVEEIHMLETRQGQKASQDGNHRSSEQVALSNSAVSTNPSTSTQREPRDVLSKRTRDEYTDLSTGNEVPLNLSYNCLSSNPHAGIGVSMAGGSSNVSLTLGLQQNNGVSLSEPYPINAAQRFGLDHPGASSEAYIMAGFEAQNRQFGRNVIGGQLLRDFVG